MPTPIEPEHSFRIAQTGEIRLAPDKPWIRFSAVQEFAAGSIEYHWRAAFRAGLVPMTVDDSFEAGAGESAIRVAGLVPVARARGPAIDKAAAVRGLAEVMWHPTGIGFCADVTWELMPDGKVQATYDDRRTRAIVDFGFDDGGRLVSAYAAARPQVEGKTVKEYPWSGIVSDYAWFGSVRVPSRAEVTWHLPSGDFTYFRCRITSVR